MSCLDCTIATAMIVLQIASFRFDTGDAVDGRVWPGYPRFESTLGTVLKGIQMGSGSCRGR
jgi:hypothetical protein